MITSNYPHFLASVRTVDEARLCTSADVVDCKEPHDGALGALPHGVVRAICNSVRPGQLVSATVGDLVPEPSSVVAAVSAMAATGVDYVKIGIFPGGEPIATIRALASGPLRQARLVGLLLADRNPDFGLIGVMADAGFAGIMLDTADKAAGALPDVMPRRRLEAFIDAAHGAGLFAGLAGSLRAVHIASLLKLKPDILGFRGALCRVHDRCGVLRPDEVEEVRAAIPIAPATSNLQQKVLS